MLQNIGIIFMELEQLSSQLDKNKSLPPVELWDPPYCGEIDLEIKSNGDWFYNGTIFKRLPLVKLLASVLKREVTNNIDHYFLVTPVEKIMIKVNDVPFMLTQWQWSDETQKTMIVKTSLDDEFILNKEHPVTLAEDGCLYVIVRRNLSAKVHRNVYYQWVELASESKTKKGTEMVFSSADSIISLGLID